MAGYIFYPHWGIKELIVAKHEALISLETVEKIFKRMRGTTQIGKIHLKENPDFPLKDFVYCGYCESKLRGYWAKGRTQKYPYYGCQEKKDKKRFQVNRDIMHDQFNELLEKVTVNEDVRNLIEETIRILRDHRNEYQALMKKDRERALNEVEDRMRRLRKMMLSTDNPHLMEELQGEWELVRLEKEGIQNELDHQRKVSEEELQSLLVQAKGIYMGPKLVRQMSNIELKKVLMNLLFGDKLYYTKEKGYRTAGNTLYDAVLSTVRDPHFLVQA